MPTSLSSRARRAAGRIGRKARRQRAHEGSKDGRLLLASELFDPWYYGLQAGRPLSAAQAADHFILHGVHDGLLANPLTDFLSGDPSPETILTELLDGSARLRPVRNLLDDVALVEAFPTAVEHAGGPVGYFLENAHSGAPVPVLGTRSWEAFVRLRTRQGRILKQIVQSGLFDRLYYEQQAGRTFNSQTAAIWHFLEVGEPSDLSPNPLFERSWYRRSSSFGGGMAFAHFLRTGQTLGAAGPHFDAPAYLAGHPEAGAHPGGPLGHYFQNAGADTLTVPDQSRDVQAVTLDKLRDTLAEVAQMAADQSSATRQARTWARWSIVTGNPADGPTRGPTVGVLSDGREWDSTTAGRLASLESQRYRDWVLRVAVDSGAPVPPAVAEAAAADPRVLPVGVDGDAWADRANALVASAEEERIAFWRPHETWSPRFLDSLLAAVNDGSGAYGAVVEAESDLVRTELGPQETLIWRPARGLAGMLVSRSALQEVPFRVEAGDQYGWDHLLRSSFPRNFVPFIAARDTHASSAPLPPGVMTSYEHVIRAERIIDWDLLRERATERIESRVSLLVPTFRDWRYTATAVATALNTGSGDMEVVVLDNGSSRNVSRILTALTAADRRVQVRRVACNTNFATGSNLAFAASTGARVVFLNNDTDPREGWLEPLVSALDDPTVRGAQPLLLYPDDSVQTAGTVFHGPHLVPSHFLTSHPREDVPSAQKLRFHAVTAACLAMRADTVAAARGFDPHFVNGMEDVDLCLRLGGINDKVFVTVTDSQVAHHESKSLGRSTRNGSNRLLLLARWGARLPGPEKEPWTSAGFEVVAAPLTGAVPKTSCRTAVTPILRRLRTSVSAGNAAGLPRLRWAIKIAAPGGPRGNGWGDVAFADDLARALRSWGQEVVVDRRHAHQRPPSDYLDDVTLTLRGLERVAAQPGATNLLWVISHPDLVQDDEIGDSFDLVYSAGAPWAEMATARSGREVRTLLQATNTDRFTTNGPVMDGLEVLFVGRTRNVFRPIVRDAIRAGADLAIFGNGWEQFIDMRHVRAEQLDNILVPDAYRGARIVLNDHWDDMARLGFFSNRLFDAAASGARVVSDAVPGLEDLFGPSVQVYRSVEELASLLDPAGDGWASDAEIARNAARIAQEHSFVERARVLLADVLDLRGVAHTLR